MAFFYIVSDMKKIKLILILALVGFVFSCSQDGLINLTDDTPDEVGEEEEEEEETPLDTFGTLLLFNNNTASNGYVLVNDAAANRVFLMTRNTEIVYEWDMDGRRLGNDVRLLPNGQLLAMLESEDPKITIGGFGGRMALINPDGSESFSFDYSTDDVILHHDAELLPNGNILTMIWERKTASEATAAGYELNVDVFPDGLIEINPNTSEIVWEWYMWDHLVQEFNASADNFGDISTEIRKVNVNHIVNDNGDISHANGIAYDAANDLIYLSANFYSEVWVIDHSTTTAEAATSSGGNFGFGGDLVYRFGNPRAYQNDMGTVLFDHNHYPNLLDDSNPGDILIFANGNSGTQSTAYELTLPSPLSLVANQDNEPQVVWSFTDSEMHSPKVSGVEDLPNGNRLITEGDFGFWEITPSGEIAWKLEAQGFFWRAYHYDLDDPAIENLPINQP
jgi:hypothetical protein